MHASYGQHKTLLIILQTSVACLVNNLIKYYLYTLFAFFVDSADHCIVTL